MLHSALGSSGSFLESKERDNSYLRSYYYNTALSRCETASCSQHNFTHYNVTESLQRSAQHRLIYALNLFLFCPAKTEYLKGN